MTFRSRGRSGNQQKSVTVMTNDPNRRSVHLSIKGIVKMLLQVKPRNLNYRDVFKGESQTLPVHVIPWEGTQFDIVSVESSKAEFEAKVLPQPAVIGRTLKNAIELAKERVASKFGTHEATRDTIVQPRTDERSDEELSSEDARTVNVTLLASAPVGRHHGKIKIHTDLKDKPVLEVPVTANVVGSVKVEPPHCNFGSVKQDEGKEKIFKVYMREASGVRITSVETSSEHVTARLLDTTRRSEYDLEVSIAPGAPVGALNGTVTLHTTDEDQPELQVRFYASVGK